MNIPARLRQVWERHQEAHRLMATPLSVLLNERAPSVWGPALTSTDPVPGITDEVNKGADINERNDRGYTVLHRWAHNSKVVQSLLALGADPDANDEDGFTPLMLACKRGDLSSVETLLAAGASPHTIGWMTLPNSRLPGQPEVHRRDITATMLIALSSCTLWSGPKDPARFEALEAMVVGPMGNQVPAFVLEPWYIPGTHLDHPVYPYLANHVQQNDVVTCSPLSMAMSKPDVAFRLLEAGADPRATLDPRPGYGTTNLLHITDSSTMTNPDTAAKTLRLIEILLDFGLSPIALDVRGEYPWHKHAHVECRARLFQAYEERLLRQSTPEDVAVDATVKPVRRRL